MTTEHNEQAFVGITPYAEWQARQRGHSFSSNAYPVRVYLVDGSVHVYVSWDYRYDELDGASTRVRKEDSEGGHHYVVAANGALHIVGYDSDVHTDMRSGDVETVSHERLFITYAPGAWLRATGPWAKDLPEKDSQQNTSTPGAAVGAGSS